MIANESVDSNLQTNESVENESKKLKIALAKINNLELKIKQKDDYIVESKLKIKQKDDYIIKLTLKINDDYNESKKIIGIMNNTLQLSYSRIEENLNTIGTLKDDLKSCFEKITDLQKSNSTNNDTNLELWIGVGLRQNFIFEQITKLNLLRPDVDWVKPMIEEIKIPEVSLQIQNRFLPSCLDTHFEFIDEDEETQIYEILSMEASLFSKTIDI